MAIEMICPGCELRFDDTRLRQPDEDVRCGRCRREFEFRQWREEACKAHRPELVRACPELAPYFDLKSSVLPERRTLRWILSERERREEDARIVRRA
jgi:hypothetical protein